MGRTDAGRRQSVFSRRYDPTTGDAGERATILTIDDGFPDGMTIDADAHLWVAMRGGGHVRR